jgi:hypothetical protein
MKQAPAQAGMVLGKLARLRAGTEIRGHHLHSEAISGSL